MIQSGTESTASLPPPSIRNGEVHHYALSIIASGVILAVLYWARTVFITTAAALIIALILEPFVSLLVRLRLPRSLATPVVSALALVILYFVGLGLYGQISSLAGDIPQFKERFTTLVDGVRERVQNAEESAARLFSRRNEIPPPTTAGSPRRVKGRQAPPSAVTPAPSVIQEVRIHQDSNPVSDYIVARLSSLYEFILMASFVPFLVYFMLSWRDHITRSFLRFFDESDRPAAARSMNSISGVARAFVVGNFLIGLSTATLSGIIFHSMHIPYAFLAGGLSGFLSIVPYLGVPLGLVPPLLAAIAGGLAPSGILLILVAVVSMHVLALNVLYPKLVGARVHLNPLVVTLALMFWGFLWDAAGLVLAIPLTAGLKTVCDNVVRLRPIGRLLGD